MRNLKKLLSVLVVVAMMVTVMVPAFAATASTPASVSAGISDTSVQKAVEELASFGIVSGMEDGQYHPEGVVTRAQMAKLADMLMGIGSAAVQATTQFSDVPATHWASGYINLAAGAGLVVGVGNGKFDPDAQVTFAQAVTILERALGYKDSFLKGTWPSNYLAQAGKDGITSGVAFTSGGMADRGAVAVMLVNALEAHPIYQNQYGDQNTWSVDTSTTLRDKNLNVKKEKDCTVSGTPAMNAGLSTTQIQYTPAGGSLQTRTVSSWIDPNKYFNLKADVYRDNSDKVLYVKVTTDPSSIVVGQVVSVSTSANLKVKVRTIDGTEVECPLSGNFNVTVDNSKDNMDSVVGGVANASLLGLYGTFVKDDSGDWSKINAYKFQENSTVVTSVDATNNFVKGYWNSGISHKVDFSQKDGYKIFNTNGQQISLGDVKAGDVIYWAFVQEALNKTYMYGFDVTNNVVTGKLAKAYSDKTTIDTTDYSVDTMANFTGYVSVDNNGTIQSYSAPNAKDAVGTTVTAYLDLIHKVRYITADAKKTSDDLFGVVDQNNQIDSKTADIYTKDGSDVAYNLTDTVYGPGNINKGDVVWYKLDKDGKIDTSDGSPNFGPNYKKIAAITGGALAATDTKIKSTDAAQNIFDIAVNKFDKDNNWIVADGSLTKYFVDPSTVLMRYYDTDPTKPEGNVNSVKPAVVKWSDIEGNSFTAGSLHAIIVTDSDQKTIKFVVFGAGFRSIAGGASYGYVNSSMYYNGSDYVIDIMGQDGTVKTYVLAGSLSDEINKGSAGAVGNPAVSTTTANYFVKKSFIAFKPDANGKLTKTQTALAVYGLTYEDGDVGGVATNYHVFGGTVTDLKNSNSIQLDTGAYIRFASDAAVYLAAPSSDVVFDSVTRSDVGAIDNGLRARILVDDNGLAKVIIIIKN